MIAPGLEGGDHLFKDFQIPSHPTALAIEMLALSQTLVCGPKFVLGRVASLLYLSLVSPTPDSVWFPPRFSKPALQSEFLIRSADQGGLLATEIARPRAQF